jgi:hypothetical protein
MRSASSHQRSAFTMVEIVAVGAMGAVMIGVLVCAVQRLNEASDRVVTQNNLRELGFAIRALPDHRKSMAIYADRYHPKAATFVGPERPDANPEGTELLAAVARAKEQIKRVGAGNAKTTTNGSAYSPTFGGFAVEFPPGEVKYKKLQDAKADEKSLHLHFVRDADNHAWVVYHLDLPANMVSAELDGAIDGFRDGFLDALEAKLVSEKKITLGNNAGHEWQMDSATRGKGLVRAYLAGNRFYMVAAFGDDDSLAAGETQRFFSSFRLKQK